MPPRSKRARKDDKDPALAKQPTTSSSSAAGQVSFSAVSNSGLIFDVPNELWLEILSYFSSVRIPTVRISDSPLLPKATLERQEALKALSQTCHTFRQQFLPELWDRFEVCATLSQAENYRHRGASKSKDTNFNLSGAWYKDISEALENKSNGLRQSPEHAKLVHKVSVALTRCSAVTVLGAFVRCLHALPNLHTLQILRAHTQMTTHLKNAFEGHRFPAVQTIVLPSHAHNVLRCCPEVKTVVCNYDDGSKLVSAIAKECKKVQKIEGFLIDEKMIKRIVKAAPNLQEVKFSGPVSVKTLDLLSSLKDLRSIELMTKQFSPEDMMKDLELVACIKLAREMLQKANGKPRLRVYHDSRYQLTTGTRWSKEVEVVTS